MPLVGGARAVAPAAHLSATVRFLLVPRPGARFPGGRPPAVPKQEWYGHREEDQKQENLRQSAAILKATTAYLIVWEWDFVGCKALWIT